MHSEQKMSFIYISPNGKSRIDRIYIPEVNKHQIKKCVHLNFPYSDHNAVLLELKDSNLYSLNRKNIWKLNTSILEDPEFQEEIKLFILKATIKRTIWYILYIYFYIFPESNPCVILLM